MAEEVKELDPSPGSEEENQDEQAQSSSAESETEEDLLSVVQDAMQMSEEADSQSDEEYEEEDEEGEYSDDELSASSEDDESFDDVPFHKHPRFKEVIDQRNSFRDRAEQYDKITDFLDTNNLSAEEAAQGFQIMAMMKSDPKAALDALNPFVQQLDYRLALLCRTTSSLRSTMATWTKMQRESFLSFELPQPVNARCGSK